MKHLAAAAAVITALAFACLAPAPASAGLASITFRPVAVSGAEAPATSPGRFDLVGLRWHGSGSVRFSVRALDGTWGHWLDAVVEEEDRPDFAAAEDIATGGWRVGNPTWVGAANRIRYRIRGDVSDLRATFVRSPELRIPLRAVAIAGSPSIVPRSAWGADESIRRNGPEYAPAIRFATVHHTAGPNDYSPAQAAAIMRGIQIYHVKSNGWNDIGYNFLVDRYGTVYEGRYGGIDRNVIGAHARGFNTGSVGVAVIGTFGTTTIPAAAQRSLEKLLAWRLDIAHVDPTSTVAVVSGGSERYPVGVPITLRAVSGHRDTGLTSCPGDALYAKLGAIASAVRALGLPKIFDPAVAGGLGGVVRFSARLSGPLAWRVVVTDAVGQELARGTGKGSSVAWTWDASLVTGKGIRWSIEVTGATPVGGTFGAPATGGGPLAVTGVGAEPATISPNDDGSADATTISYTTSATATVSVTLLDATGVALADLVPPTRQTGGTHSVQFDGLGEPDGIYTAVVTAIDAAGLAVTAQTEVAISRTLANPALAPATISPNGDGKADSLRVTYELVAPATVRLRLLHEGKWVATAFNGPQAAGRQTLSWNGAKRTGVAPDGAYTAVLEVTDSVATGTAVLPFTRDATAPRLQLLAHPFRLRVSEAARVSVRVNGSLRRLQASGPSTLPLPGVRKIRSLLAVAVDAAGNRSTLRRP